MKAEHQAAIKERGQTVSILRDTPVETQCIIGMIRRSNDVVTTEHERIGDFLPVSLKAGEVVQNGARYLLVTALLEASPEGGIETALLAVCNHNVTVNRFEDVYTGDVKTGEEWVAHGTTYGCLQIVTSRMRLEDPGLLPEATAKFRCPAGKCLVDDRLSLTSGYYRVIGVDEMTIPGLALVQLGVDAR